MLRAITILTALAGLVLLTTAAAAADEQEWQKPQRSPIEQITERIRLLEREFELIIRQFSRTVLGLNVHQGHMMVNRSPTGDQAVRLEERADPAAANTDSNVPSVIPGMEILSQLASASSRNPIALLQQLLTTIMLQFQALMRTLTSLPGSEVLGR